MALKDGIYSRLPWALRTVPETVRWIVGSGCSGPAPARVKTRIIRSYLARYDVSAFVETGTYLGDTLQAIAASGIGCTSIELSSELHARAVKRFRRCKNVTLLHGDSGTKLPSVVDRLDGPALFWLDGHYSAGITAMGNVQSPVSVELQCLLEDHERRHVILIDDARCFTGRDGYPFLDELLALVRRNSRYEYEVSADIIRLTPL